MTIQTLIGSHKELGHHYPVFPIFKTSSWGVVSQLFQSSRQHCYPVVPIVKFSLFIKTVSLGRVYQWSSSSRQPAGGGGGAMSTSRPCHHIIRQYKYILITPNFGEVEEAYWFRLVCLSIQYIGVVPLSD